MVRGRYDKKEFKGKGKHRSKSINENQSQNGKGKLKRYYYQNEDYFKRECPKKKKKTHDKSNDFGNATVASEGYETLKTEDR